MSGYTISGDLDELRRLTFGITGAKEALEKAAASATNKTATSSRAFLARSVAATYRIKVGTVKKEIKIRKASARQRTIEAALYGKGAPGIALQNFFPTPRRVPSTRRTKNGGYTPKAGIKVEVRRGNRKQITGAFVSKMGSGHIGVYQRSGSKQLPVKELFGPSPVNMIAANEDISDELNAYTITQQKKNIASAAKYFLSKADILPGFE
ncbi:MAG: phage tail protein [Kiritimatiellia bacterium]